jgi:hypothetical protein
LVTLTAGFTTANASKQNAYGFTTNHSFHHHHCRRRHPTRVGLKQHDDGVHVLPTRVQFLFSTSSLPCLWPNILRHLFTRQKYNTGVGLFQTNKSLHCLCATLFVARHTTAQRA